MITLVMMFVLAVADDPSRGESPQDWRQAEQDFRQAFRQANRDYKPRHAESADDEIDATDLATIRKFIPIRGTRFGILHREQGFQVVWATPGQITRVGEPWESLREAQAFAHEQARQEPLQLRPHPPVPTHHTASHKAKHSAPIKRTANLDQRNVGG